MKTTFSIVILLVFSALILAPNMPKDYPSKDVVAQQADINLKEGNLDLLINKIETNLAIDSIHINSFKQIDNE